MYNFDIPFAFIDNFTIVHDNVVFLFDVEKNLIEKISTDTFNKVDKFYFRVVMKIKNREFEYINFSDIEAINSKIRNLVYKSKDVNKHFRIFYFYSYHGYDMFIYDIVHDSVYFINTVRIFKFSSDTGYVECYKNKYENNYTEYKAPSDLFGLDGDENDSIMFLIKEIKNTLKYEFPSLSKKTEVVEKCTARDDEVSIDGDHIVEDKTINEDEYMVNDGNINSDKDIIKDKNINGNQDYQKEEYDDIIKKMFENMIMGVERNKDGFNIYVGNFVKKHNDYFFEGDITGYGFVYSVPSEIKFLNLYTGEPTVYRGTVNFRDEEWSINIFDNISKKLIHTIKSDNDFSRYISSKACAGDREDDNEFSDEFNYDKLSSGWKHGMYTDKYIIIKKLVDLDVLFM